MEPARKWQPRATSYVLRFTFCGLLGGLGLVLGARHAGQVTALAVGGRRCRSRRGGRGEEGALTVRRRAAFRILTGGGSPARGQRGARRRRRHGSLRGRREPLRGETDRRSGLFPHG